MPVERELEGKVALVTGAARGIGAAAAIELARNGADVAISYLSADDAAEAVMKEAIGFGVRAIVRKVDQADPVAAALLVDEVVAELGRLDILVNNAGTYVLGAITDDLDPEVLRRQLDVNVVGLVATTRAAARVLADGGRVISVSTSGAERAFTQGIGDYVATKAAINAYTRAWCRDLGSRGITVNAVQPGPINTDLNPETADHAAMMSGLTALGRYGQPHEVGKLIAFLAGPGGAFITGEVIRVDGGLNA